MLYSILPPIIVILSLVGIVIFLFKKAPKIVDLKENKEELEEQPQNFWGKTISFLRCSFCPGLKKIVLSFLAWLGEKIKAIFSKTKGRMQMARERKKSIDDSKVEQEKEGEEETAIEKLERYDAGARRRRVVRSVPSRSVDLEEKEVRPMISEKVVSPRSKAEMKDMLEDVLIERIALNPKDVEAYERLGEYYIDIGNYEHAKECVKQVIKLNPGNRDAKYKLRRLERIIHG